MEKKYKRKMNPSEVFEMWKCGKKGKHVGCQQGCEEEYGTYACGECPDPNGPSRIMIIAHEKAKKSLFGTSDKR